MKFACSVVSAIILSVAGVANGALAGVDGKSAVSTVDQDSTLSAEDLHRILFQLKDIDTQEELMDVCGLSQERLQALQELQRWLITQEFAPLEKDMAAWKFLDYFAGEGTFQAFKEKSVAIIFALVDKDPSVDELGFRDLMEIVSMSGVSGLSFEELLECVGNGVSLSYDEILYIFCLGEPHFSTWQGAHFDYHGACDLVLVHNEEFANGKGIDLHVRTEQLMPEGAYSFVSDAALRIGKDVLEVSKDGSYYFNGKKDADLSTVGGFVATRSVQKNCVQNPENGESALGCSQMLTYDIVLGTSEHIQMKVAKDMVHVDVKGRPSQFYGSVGVMGTYPHKSHGRVSRDGQTVMQDVDIFAQEWQVHPELDGKLFQNDRFPQFPQQCTPASTAHASEPRRLRAETAEQKALKKIAHGSCDHLAKSNVNMFENCVFDIMATGDAEMASLVYGVNTINASAYGVGEYEIIARAYGSGEQSVSASL